MDVKDRIKELRIALGLTQQEFADRLKVAKQTVSKWETAQRVVPDATLNSIARTFDASYFWLKEGVGDMFLNLPDSMLDDLGNRYELNDFDKRLLKMYMNLSVDEREAIQGFLKVLLKEKDEG